MACNTLHKKKIYKGILLFDNVHQHCSETNSFYRIIYLNQAF